MNNNERNTNLKDWNIFSVIRNHAKMFPEKVLISVDNNEVTYGDFIEEVIKIANALKKLDIEKGDKICLILSNSILWYKIFWAIVYIGALPVPLDPQIGEWELKQLLTLLETRICFIIPKYRANPVLQNICKIQAGQKLLASVIVIGSEDRKPFVYSYDSFIAMAKPGDKISVNPVHYNDLLMYACTSGTTGNPKIIAVEHGGFHKSQKDMADYLSLDENDIMLLGMPLYHQGGFGMGLQVILNGGSVIYQSRFDPEFFLKTISEKKVTAIQLTTTLAKILLTVPDFSKYDLSSLKMSYFAGEVLPDEIAYTFYEKLKIRVINIIGSSETGTMVVWDSDFDRDFDVNTYKKLEFTDIKIVGQNGNEVKENETGNILIFTDAVLREYYKNELETSEKIKIIDGKRWLNTGDCAKKLAGGRIQFVGRSKRIIKRGGNLIYPEEIEAFLLTHPKIKAVAIVKQKHNIFSEMIVAHVQTAEDDSLTRGDLLKYCRGKLSSYKIPDKFYIVKKIPKDIGKVQFKYLRAAKNK